MDSCQSPLHSVIVFHQSASPDSQPQSLTVSFKGKQRSKGIEMETEHGTFNEYAKPMSLFFMSVIISGLEGKMFAGVKH